MDSTLCASQPVTNFGPFSLHRTERLLLRDGQPLDLPPASIEILQTLVDAPGEVFGRQDLATRVSPGSAAPVDLWKHIARLNLALQSEAGHYIAQLPGRGYLFVGAIQASETPPKRLRAKDVVGRADTVAMLAQMLHTQRLLSIVGPGGMGKTTVALALADVLAPQMPGGVHFIDLAAIASSGLVAGTVATALGIELRGAAVADPLPLMCQRLAGRQLLIVLDNCEHLVDETARLAEGLLACPGLRLLATSREPLRARAEVVHHLPALAFPAAAAPLDLQQALAYPAVELFVKRAASASEGFVLAATQVADVCEICRRLDGLPLAIELAAPHAATLGTAGLRERLAERLAALQMPAPQDSPARHQTLQATIAWSHALLGGTERVVLRRLALFRGAFPVESALRLGTTGGLERGAALEALIGLVSKSLVAVELVRGHVAYRLLETTRAYARDKLRAAGELAAASQAHADDCCERLQSAELEWQQTAATVWVSQHRVLVDDVRAALDWSSSPGHDLLAAVRVALTAVPLFGRLTLLCEFVPRIRELIARVRAEHPERPEFEFRLTTALGDLVLFTEGQAQSVATYGRAYTLSTQMTEARDRTAGLAVMWVHGHFVGDYAAMHTAADRLLKQMRVEPDPPMDLFARRAMAYALHYRGDQVGARRYASSALAETHANWPGFYLFPTMIQRDVAMRMVLARSLWISGLPEQAAEMAAASVEWSLKDSPASLCVALAIAACPVALWSGDDAAAQAMVDRMRQHALLHGVQFGTCWAAHLQAVLDRRAGAAPLPAATAAPPQSAVEKDMLATLQELPVDAETLARAEACVAGWCAPEVLRVQALALRQAAAPAAAALFERSLALSRFQDALAWELRAATNLATAPDGGVRREHLGRLETVYRRFSEGFATADLRAARALLDAGRG